MFNPFGKYFRDLKAKDLEILKDKQVAEGWHVEYKESRQKAEKVAKSVSSFANSRGGIYFVGIQADDDNRCKKVVGVEDSPDVIRDCVKGHIQPFPYFETFAVKLVNNMKVLIVVVPESKTPPHIHSDGRIYVRQEAASDPVFQSDRHVIDGLYSRAESWRKDLQDFRTMDYELCQGESNQPYLQIFMNTVPYKHFMMSDLFKGEEITKMLAHFHKGYEISETIDGKNVPFRGNITLDTVNTYHNSVALRYLNGSDISRNGLTVEVDIHGNTKVLLPLEYTTYDNLEKEDELFQRYHIKLSKSNLVAVDTIKFINVKTLYGAILGLFVKVSKYLKDRGYEDTLEVKMRLSDSWRTTLYCASETFVFYIEEWGVPICMKNDQYFPEYDLIVKLSELKAKPITQTALLFAPVASALGMTGSIATQAVIQTLAKK